MERRQLNAHPSVMFVYSQNGRCEVILSGYDGGYPRIIYASAPNLLGGNPEQADKTRGPLDVLKREVEEEIAREEKNVDWKGRVIQWASLEDITLIRSGILNNVRAYDDFFVDARAIMARTRGERRENVQMSDIYKAIYSAFFSIVSQEVIECVRDNINAGKRFYTEGFIGVYNLSQLEAAGEFSTAHVTAPILNEYFGTKIPYPEQLKVSGLGSVRKKYTDYDSDFEHLESIWDAK